MRSKLAWGLFAAVSIATGCSTAIMLTDQGEVVHVATDAELPGGCNLIGDIPIGLQSDAARPPTEGDLVILMRNKTGDQGGNYVVVDSKEQRGETEEGRFWVGRGRAYNCPPPEAERVAPPEETSGGENTEEGEPAEGEEGGGEDEPTEELDDSDLL